VSNPAGINFLDDSYLGYIVNAKATLAPFQNEMKQDNKKNKNKKKIKIKKNNETNLKNKNTTK
jgi:hypothetical protein